MQEVMLAELLRGGSPGTNVLQVIGSLREDLDPARFRRAWETTVRRHDALRLRVRLDPAPIQEFPDSSPLSWHQEDWSALPAHERAARRAALVARDRDAGFSLNEWPWTRVALVRLGPREWLLLWTVHHLLLDGGSLPIVLGDLFDAYARAEIDDAPSNATPAPRFETFAAWSAAQDSARHTAYWRETLAGLEESTPPPLANEAFGGSAGTANTRYLRSLPEGTTTRLRDAAARLGVTPATLVNAAWAVVLARHTGRADVVFGVVRAGRPSEVPDSDRMAGCFVNTLPLRLEVPGEAGVLPWLQTVHARWQATRAHVGTRWSGLIEASPLTPGTPLMQSLVLVDTASLDHVLRQRGPEWQNRDFDLLRQPGIPWELGITLEPELEVRLLTPAGAVAETAAAALTDRFLAVLDVLQSPGSLRVRDLPMIAEAERSTVLEDWNRTMAEYPRDRRLDELVIEQARRTPDAPAVLGDGRSLEYRELEARAEAVARRLRKLGAGPGARIALAMERSIEQIVGLLGILRTGAAYVPLDPAYPAERLEFLLGDSAAAVVVSTAADLDRMPASVRTRPTLLLTPDEPMDAGAPVADGDSASATDPAYVIYTSGSTGRPKGVVVGHGSAVNYVTAVGREFGLGPADRFLQFASASFDVSVQEIFGALAHGAGLVLRPPEMTATPGVFLSECERLGVTVAHLPVAFWHELVAALAAGEAKCPGGLRLVAIGGEQPSPERVDTWHRHVPAGLRLMNNYGPTECTVTATWGDLGPGDRAPMGRPVPNARCYVLDLHGQPSPVGVDGELHVGGDCLALGYLNQAGLTAERFVPDPFRSEPGARRYRTGDRARWRADGLLEFRGRLDAQLKIRGHRVEPGEVEAALAGFSGLEACVAGAVEAGGDRRLAAWCAVPGRSGDPSLPGELRAWLRRRLPEPLIPTEFVVLEQLPRNANGKLDRRSLPAPTPPRRSEEDPGNGAAPRTPSEEFVAGVFRQVLRRPGIGVEESFFDLGGHSLLAMQVIARLQSELGEAIPMRVLFESPTARALASWMDARRTALSPTPARPKLVKVSREARRETRPGTG